MKIQKIRFITGAWLACLLCLCWQNVYGASSVEFVTPGFALKFLPDRAWTYSRIVYQGNVIGREAGFYGTTVGIAPGLFVGSGHADDGAEEVLSVKVFVDGNPVSVESLDSVVDCKELRIIKTSRIANLLHEAEVHLQEQRIDLHYRIKAVEQRFLELIYPFMFCWSPETTEWLAVLKDGERVEGEFSSDESWKLEKDVQWTAVYAPTMALAVAVIFPDDLPEGKIHKHGFWDRQQYHKQYFQSWWRSEIGVDEEMDYRATIIPVPAPENDWKQSVEKAVAKTPL